MRVRATGFYTSGLSARRAAAALLLSGLLLAPGCGGASHGEWKIVFPAFRDGDWSIYVVGRDGGRPVRIGASPELAFGESLLASPDGRRLLLSGGFPGNAYRLVVMNADGSGRKDLGDGDPGTAAWSPDGRRIVFAGSRQPGLFVAGDARRVRQVGDGLPAPRALGRRGPVAAHPPRVGRRRCAGTGDEEG